MSAIYPEAWNTLEYYWVRGELIEYLKSATSLTYGEDLDEIRFLIHFIFDDHDFRGEMYSMVGVSLFDEDEDALIKDFAAKLDRAIGPQKAWRTVPRTEWGPVAEAARQALDRLLMHGEVKYS